MIPLGGPPLVGLTVRPIFTMQKEVEAVLRVLAENTVPRRVVKMRKKSSASIVRSATWGTDFVPSYDADARVVRALQWTMHVETFDAISAASTILEDEAAAAGRDPERNPEMVESGVQKKNGTQRTCWRHHKPLCENCTVGKVALRLCCAHHHSVGDGLPVVKAFCAKHLRTACGFCVSKSAPPAICCSKGHHVCKSHSLPACVECKKEVYLKDRRPADCCALGHHHSVSVEREKEIFVTPPNGAPPSAVT